MAVRKLGNYTGGRWVESKSSKVIDVVNPAKDEVLAQLPLTTKEETEEVLNGYNITSAQLPKIKIIDPVCELIGAKLGQILRITRNSQTADVAVYYRLVVA